MSGFKWRAAICCESGLVRKNNEDNFYFNGLFKTVDQANQVFAEETNFKGNGLFAVFDGMGGESYGELASSIVASLLSDYAKTILAQGQKYIENFFYEANRQLCLEAEKRHESMAQQWSWLSLAKII
jgi:protein phosphatase